MKKRFDIHEEHAKDDIKRFEGIDQHFTQLETAAAYDAGGVKTTAKTWGIVGGIGTAIIGAVAAAVAAPSEGTGPERAGIRPRAEFNFQRAGCDRSLERVNVGLCVRH